MLYPGYILTSGQGGHILTSGQGRHILTSGQGGSSKIWQPMSMKRTWRLTDLQNWEVIFPLIILFLQMGEIQMREGEGQLC